MHNLNCEALHTRLKETVKELRRLLKIGEHITNWDCAQQKQRMHKILP